MKSQKSNRHSHLGGRLYPLLSIVILLLVWQCSGRFVKKEDTIDLNREYAGVYVTTQEIEIGNNEKLESGKIVKIYIKSTSETLKFYAYDHKEDRESATGKCILYLTADDFPDKKFDKEMVIKEVNKILKPFEEKKDNKK